MLFLTLFVPCQKWVIWTTPLRNFVVAETPTSPVPVMQGHVATWTRRNHHDPRPTLRQLNAPCPKQASMHLNTNGYEEVMTRRGYWSPRWKGRTPEIVWFALCDRAIGRNILWSVCNWISVFVSIWKLSMLILISWNKNTMIKYQRSWVFHLGAATRYNPDLRFTQHNPFLKCRNTRRSQQSKSDKRTCNFGSQMIIFPIFCFRYLFF